MTRSEASRSTPCRGASTSLSRGELRDTAGSAASDTRRCCRLVEALASTHLVDRVEPRHLHVTVRRYLDAAGEDRCVVLASAARTARRLAARASQRSKCCRAFAEAARQYERELLELHGSPGPSAARLAAQAARMRQLLGPPAAAPAPAPASARPGTLRASSALP